MTNPYVIQYTYVDERLHDLGLDAKDIREMSMDEYAEVRRALGMGGHDPDWTGRQERSQAAISNEIKADFKRSLAMSATYRTPIAPYDYEVISNSHPYHPENPFNVWRRERADYIDGDDTALARMVAAVCVEDWDRYDEVAHEENEEDRRANPPKPVQPPPPPWWRRCMVWRTNA